MSPIFDLRFKNLKSVLARAEELQSPVNWLSISSGSFRLMINGQSLFEYHLKRVQEWLRDLEYRQYLQLSGLWAQDVDYMVDSFYIELNSALPFLSDSVPTLVHELYLCPMEAQLDYRDLWADQEDALAQKIGKKAASEQSNCAVQYFYENSFTHLGVDIPETHAWRYGDDVYIRINSMERIENGEPCFAYPQHCVYRLPHSRFINECRQFFQSYLDGMKHRIETLRPILPTPEESEYRSFESLMAVHNRLQDELDATLNIIKPQAWQDVWQANQAAGIDLVAVVEKWQKHRLPVVDVH